MKMPARAELIELANDYIEGELDQEKKKRLEGWLEEDVEARRVFVDFLHDHAALYWRHMPPLETTAEELLPPGKDKIRDAAAGRPGTLVASLVLAALGFACLVGAAGFFWFDSAETGAAAKALESQAKLQAESMAAVTRLEGQAVAGGSRILNIGDALAAGEEVTMEVGLIEVVYSRTGVQAIATAPLRMVLVDGKYLRLDNGELKLNVPPQGIGFVVETRERLITDLGTSFVVTAHPDESMVFVLEGEVAISETEHGAQRLMGEGEYAVFRREREAVYGKRKLKGLPELYPLRPATEGLLGQVMGLEERPGLSLQSRPPEDHIGRRVLPLVRSGFRDQSCLKELRMGKPVRFGGIAGAFGGLPLEAGCTDISPRYGWLAWYSGKVMAPAPGRYRFWGYADNHLVVAIDGRPVFEGSRFGSAFREELGVPRQDHLGLPCLNAETGFASSEWIEVGEEPVQLDILFGEMSNPFTAGLLLIERESEVYEETFWGQPRWPIFLTERPDPARAGELRNLSDHLEERLKGAFSVSGDAVWQVLP